MPAHSIYLARLSDAERAALEKRLYDRQSGKCFLCDEPIDLDVHGDSLHIDHIIPIVAKGADDPINFALTHASCNERKGATNLEIAKLLLRFQKIQDKAKAENGRGANLEDILWTVCAESRNLRIKVSDGVVRFSLADDPKLHDIPLYTDPKSRMQYFFRSCPSSICTTMIASILARSAEVYADSWKNSTQVDRSSTCPLLGGGQTKMVLGQ